MTCGTANVTLLQADWMLKSQKGNWSDKTFPITAPQWFVWVHNQSVALSGFISNYDVLLNAVSSTCDVTLDQSDGVYMKRSCSPATVTTCFIWLGLQSAICTSAHMGMTPPRQVTVLPRWNSLTFDEEHTHKHTLTWLLSALTHTFTVIHPSLFFSCIWNCNFLVTKNGCSLKPLPKVQLSNHSLAT